MKLNLFLSAALIAGTSILSFAQTHKEGMEYYRADQFSNAKELLQRNYNNAGTDKAVSEYYLGMIALQDKDVKGAESHFTKGTQLNPENAYNYIGLGQVALINGSESDAKKLFDQAKKLDKNNPSVEIAIARAYYDVDPVKFAQQVQKNVDDARKHDKKFTNVDVYLFDGDRKRDAKDFGGAGNAYEMATTYNPNATEAYVKYADLFTQVNPQYAINMLNNLLKVNPNSALGQRELANAYYNAQQYKEAAAQYEKYVKNPNHFKQDEDRLAFLLFVDGDYQQGYDFASGLLAQNPNNFTAQRFQFMNAAQLDSMRDKLLPLAEALLAAHKANPQANKFAPVDYNLIGGELLDAGRPDEALVLFNEAITEDPENPEYYRQLSQVYLKQKDYVKTAGAYDNYIAKKSSPSYNDIVQQARYNYYAGASQLIDNPPLAQQLITKASQLADQALEISADYPTPYIIKGESAVALGASDQDRETAAVPYYTKAITIIEGSADPSRYASNLRDLYTYMGNYYLKQMNDIPSAIQYFDKYIDLTPSDQATIDYVNSLRKRK